jgi:hypothetical protein
MRMGGGLQLSSNSPDHRLSELRQAAQWRQLDVHRLRRREIISPRRHTELVLALDGVIDEAQTMLILCSDPSPFRNALKEPRHAR